MQVLRHSQSTHTKPCLPACNSTPMEPDAKDKVIISNSPSGIWLVLLYCRAPAPCVMELVSCVCPDADGAAELDLGGLEVLVSMLAGDAVLFILPDGQTSQRLSTTAVGGKAVSFSRPMGGKRQPAT